MSSLCRYTHCTHQGLTAQRMSRESAWHATKGQSHSDATAGSKDGRGGWLLLDLAKVGFLRLWQAVPYAVSVATEFHTARNRRIEGLEVQSGRAKEQQR